MESRMFREYKQVMTVASNLVGSLEAQLLHLLVNGVMIGTYEVIQLMKNNSQLIDRAVDEFYEGNDIFNKFGMVFIESFDPDDFNKDISSTYNRAKKAASSRTDMNSASIDRTILHMVPLYIKDMDCDRIDTWLLFAFKSTEEQDKAQLELIKNFIDGIAIAIAHA